MSKRFGFLLLAIQSVGCISSYAQTGPTGTWRVEGNGDAFPWAMVLQVEGSNLTGAVSSCSSNRGAIEVFEGKVDGDTITFKCKSLNQVRTMTFTGKINADEMALSWRKQVQAGGTPNAADDALFGPSAPARITAKRVPDGELAGLGPLAKFVPASEFAAAVNLPEKDFKVEGRLFLPKKVSHVRGVIVVIGWGLGFQVYDDPAWRKLTETLQLGLLRATLSHIAAGMNNGDLAAFADRGGADGLVILLQRLAQESGTRSYRMLHSYSGDSPVAVGLDQLSQHHILSARSLSSATMADSGRTFRFRATYRHCFWQAGRIRRSRGRACKTYGAAAGLYPHRGRLPSSRILRMAIRTERSCRSLTSS